MSKTTLPLKLGLVRCAETSVANQRKLRSNPDERSYKLHRDKNLISGSTMAGYKTKTEMHTAEVT
jgi:hypothetical protein